MKKLSAMLLVAAAILLLIVVVGCERKVTEVVEDGTGVCQQCHSDNTLVVAISAQWANSVHATGGNFERNTSPCSRCHTSEGFVAYLNTGDEGSPENPSAIGCFACHMPHTNYDFTLRTDVPVELEYGGTFDLSNGNLCANCHQIRTPSPDIPDSGTIEITSSRWGPHHGPQGNVFSGNGAYVFSGASYSNSSHTTAITNGCPTCHMAAPYGVQAGGHTWNMAYESHGAEEALVEGCNAVGCHTSVEDFEYRGVYDSVQVLLDTLRSALITAGVMDSSDHANVPGGGSLELAADQAGALFNYLIFLEDRSHGIHNPTYTFDALEASIAALEGSL